MCVIFAFLVQDKCGLPFGGPTWCMTEDVANATYRAFNYPHHTASYWASNQLFRKQLELAKFKDYESQIVTLLP